MVILVGEQRIQMRRVHPAGVFAGMLEGPDIPDYRLETAYPDGAVVAADDPYRYWPTLGALDLHLLAEGRHEGLWRHLGAQVRMHQGAPGTSFAVWAPGARSVRVVGDFNGWDGRLHPMRVLGSSGVWEIFLPGVGPGAHYKFEVLSGHGQVSLRADPFAFATEVPPATASIVTQSRYEWQDAAWFATRATTDLLHAPVSIYECHLGSWRLTQDADGGWRPLTYREAAEVLPGYLTDLGFTHVEFLPVAEHPFSGSWGYQVTGYYAPTARFGTPDDFRYLVDRLHQAGIGVLVDWVAGHFPKDDWALARFDGTALYEHADPRLGEHPDWGTLVFNYGRHEVRNFLLANALYWIEEFHLDGLRVDAVASMLYLDYSRREGEWVTNRFGGRENLEAIDFIKEVNAVVYQHHPSVMLVAEESTSWPAVSRPTYLGGLGFGFKWNMGWMNDTLVYFSKDPIHRRYHHHELTFALLYAFTENFILPLSHDEVSHGKGSLLGKMPGDRWQQFANLRSLLAWMWAHPAGNCCSWAARSPRTTSGGMTAAWTGTCSATPSTPECRHWSGRSTPSTVTNPPCGSRTSTGPASAGSTPTIPTTACCRSCGSRPPPGAPWPAWPTSRRCPALTTASDFRRPDAGSRSSTPTAPNSAAATPSPAPSPPRHPAGTTWTTPPRSPCRLSASCGWLTSPARHVRMADPRPPAGGADRSTLARHLPEAASARRRIRA